jgi:hypothetical protein
MDMKTTTTRRAELNTVRGMKLEGLRNAKRLGHTGAVAQLEADVEAIDAALATERVGRL